jgi:hypothetical protein
MSEVKWCDFGAHAFSADDNDAVEDTVRMKVRQEDGTYRERQFRRDICGPHVSAAVNFDRPELTEGGSNAVSPRSG